jgi:hypothetical protein
MIELSLGACIQYLGVYLYENEDTDLKKCS